jgi:hypothetical protein
LEPLQAVSDAILPWIIRIAGLFWLLGALMLFRQIRAEMALDRMTATIDAFACDLAANSPAEAPATRRPKSDAESAEEAWTDRDDAARRGWIAGQAVVLAATGIAMMLMHSFASWLVALLVLGQGVYFFWREYTARHAPSPEAAAHARPSKSTVSAGWFSLVVAMLVWAAAFRDLLN